MQSSLLPLYLVLIILRFVLSHIQPLVWLDFSMTDL
jgi:hypothetical protein